MRAANGINDAIQSINISEEENEAEFSENCDKLVCKCSIKSRTLALCR